MDKTPLMASKLRLVFTITMVFFCFYGTAQDTYWRQEASHNEIEPNFSKRFDVQKGTVFTFDEVQFKRSLRSSSFAKGNSRIVHFPNEEGELIAFQVSEAPVLSPELSKKYPQIKSYAGYALNQSKDKIRFSVSQNGIQSMFVPSNGKANSYMQKNSNDSYILYTRDANSTLETELVCSTTATMAKNIDLTRFKQPVSGQVLRKFRLAVSASGEYTTFHGGTVADALAAINATVTRVNEVFETDLAVTFELVANTDEVIFTDPETDPYNGSLSSSVQNTMTSTIGEANYDLGILFHRIESGADGNSGFIGAVCVDNRKGSAFAAIPNPVGDVFDLDFIAHEMGHQFGANHSFSHQDEQNSGVQVEPGSGTTIMGYAGIAEENNVAPNGDDYFHYVSIVQMADYLNTVDCAEIINLTNAPPVATPLGGFAIPKSTAFVLTANATDTDIADILTYTWEQIDDGLVTTSNFGPENTSGGMFRSQKPSLSPERYFPKLSRVVEGNLTQTNPTINTAWETISNVERELNFAMTVRDNAIGGGQVTSDLVTVFVSRDAGPFVVTSQSTSVVMTAGSAESITWDVANTFLAPIGATLVDIFLSTDGGLTFPITLADDVANDGAHTVVIPGNPSTEARIMIKASNNIFFAVNAADFTIEESEIVLNFTDLSYEVCQPDMLVVPFVYETYMGFAEEVTFSVDAPPAGLDISFTPTTAIVDDTPVNITFSNTQNLPVGSYPIKVVATSLGNSKEVTIDLNVYDTNFSEVVLVSPFDGFTDAPKSMALEWEEQLAATSYEVEIATDIDFNTIVETADVISNSYTPTSLNNDAAYFWRVKPENSCAEGAYGAPFNFTTIEFNCISNAASGLPLAISSTGTPTVTSKIVFFEDIPLSDINVSLELEHSYLEDITVSLTSPTGTVVTLFSNACGNLKNVDAVFDDNAPGFVCNGTPGIQGTVRPSGLLASFEGESIKGEWTLTISDDSPADGGSLKGFSLEVCIEGNFRPDDDNDGVFDDGPDLCLGTPDGTTVDSSGCPVYLFPSDNFSIRLQSEACRSSNDGSITIDANQVLNYTVQITGNGVDTSTDFTSTYIESDLSAGTYSVCINGTDGTIVYEERCFEVVISEPEALGVSSKVSLETKIVDLDLTGGVLYNVELNGILTQSQASNISLNLQEGTNTLKVSTDLPCQGIYEEQFIISKWAVVYPNPFVDFVKVSFSGNVSTVMVDVFSAEGRLVQSKKYKVNGVEMELDFSSLPIGLYQLRLAGENVKKTVKLLKR